MQIYENIQYFSIYENTYTIKIFKIHVYIIYHIRNFWLDYIPNTKEGDILIYMTHEIYNEHLKNTRIKNLCNK